MEDGKRRLYWSVVENRRLDIGRVVELHALCALQDPPPRKSAAALPAKSSL